MILNKKKNKGFTLVELIVAIAVLALLITAVVTMMSHESVILKKNEADIAVQNAAQETYNDISDIIMQANSIKISAYVPQSGAAIVFPKKQSGEEVAGFSFNQVTFTKKSEAIGTEKNFEDNGSKMTNGPVSDFYLKKTTVSGSESSTVYSTLYLKRITVKYSVPYDSAYSSGVTVPAGTVNDTCTAEIIFEGNKIYITRDYVYMNLLDATFSDTSSAAEKEACLYTSKLNYVKTSAGDQISAAIATVDSDNQRISLELKFLDNGMTYNVSGITNVRNSFVFVDPK